MRRWPLVALLGGLVASLPGLRIILTVSEGYYRIVARRSAGISSLADLKGKRIATFPSTSSAYYSTIPS